MKPAATPDRLIRTLFGALTEVDWTTAFLHELCRATRTQSAALIAVDLTARKDSLTTYMGAEAAAAAAYEERFGAVNPWRAANAPHSQHAGDVVISDEVLPLSSLKRTPFWSEFLRPMDVAHGVGLVGLKSAHEVASLTLLRSERRGAYRERDLALLRTITPHWVNACAIRSRLGVLTESVRVYDNTVDRLELGVFFLDADGAVLRSNPAAEALQRQNVLRTVRGRLTAVHGAARIGLQRAIDAALDNSVEAAPAPHAAVSLHDAQGKAVAHAAVHRLAWSVARRCHDACAVVFVQPLSPSYMRPRLRQALAACYSLTGREAELAARLDSGEDLDQAAAGMALSEGACRTRLKTIFGKMGVRSQVELGSVVRSLRAALGT